MQQFKLKQARRAKGKTQKDMAQTLGISISAYSKKENNQQILTPKQLKEIKKVLTLSNDAFIDIFFSDWVDLKETNINSALKLYPIFTQFRHKGK